MADITVTRIGGATLILDLGPVRVLVDPAFARAGQRVYLGWFRWGRRPIGPALDVVGLTDIDVVLLTQLQADHWDSTAAAGLPKTVRLITTPHAAGRLRHGPRGFRKAQGVRRGKPVTTHRGFWSLQVTAVSTVAPGGIWRALQPPASGYVLTLRGDDDAPAAAVYVTGETQRVSDSTLARIREAAPTLDLVVATVGGRPLSGSTHSAMPAADVLPLVTALAPRAIAVTHTGFTPDEVDQAESALRQATPALTVVPAAPAVPHRLAGR